MCLWSYWKIIQSFICDNSNELIFIYFYVISRNFTRMVMQVYRFTNQLPFWMISGICHSFVCFVYPKKWSIKTSSVTMANDIMILTNLAVNIASTSGKTTSLLWYISSHIHLNICERLRNYLKIINAFLLGYIQWQWRKRTAMCIYLKKMSLLGTNGWKPAHYTMHIANVFILNVRTYAC